MFRPRLITGSGTRQGQRGISLIEVTVVLLVITIIAAFVAPQVIAYVRMYRLGVGGRNLATALQRARYLATSNNTRAGVFVDELQRVFIEQYDAEGKLEPQKKGAVNLPDGVSVSPDAPRQIAFDGRGVITPMPRESPAIRLNDANGYYLIVTVSPTGQVTVSEAQNDSRT